MIHQLIDNIFEDSELNIQRNSNYNMVNFKTILWAIEYVGQYIIEPIISTTCSIINNEEKINIAIIIDNLNTNISKPIINSVEILNETDKNHNKKSKQTTPIQIKTEILPIINTNNNISKPTNSVEILNETDKNNNKKSKQTQTKTKPSKNTLNNSTQIVNIKYKYPEITFDENISNMDLVYRRGNTQSNIINMIHKIYDNPNISLNSRNIIQNYKKIHIMKGIHPDKSGVDHITGIVYKTQTKKIKCHFNINKQHIVEISYKKYNKLYKNGIIQKITL